MSESVLRFTIYKSDPFGHGGEKRTAQLTEILFEQDLEFEIIPTGMDIVNLSYNYFRKVLLTLRYYLWVINITGWKFRIKSILKAIRLISQFKGVYFLPGTKIPSVILWETTKIEFSYIIPLFRSKGLKIIAIPHNIESLVSGLKSGLTNQVSPKWLSEELKVLSECDMVFAISKEETLLLKQHRIRAEYLPYYPTRDILEFLSKIRAERIKSYNEELNFKKILLLGSAINPPTKEGMINRICFFLSHSEIKCKISVAGFGTEQFKEIKDNADNINFLGEISRDKLFQLMIDTDCLLVHQPPTSGVLCRIIEALIAGVPVLANFESSRDYYGLDGLNIYNDDSKFINHLKTKKFKIPNIPEKPLYEINSFQDILHKMILGG